MLREVANYWIPAFAGMTPTTLQITHEKNRDF